MDRLPPVSGARPAWLRPVLVGAGATVGSAVTFGLSKVGGGIRISNSASEWVDWLSTRLPGDLATVASLAGMALVPVVCLSLAAAAAVWAWQAVARS